MNNSSLIYVPCQFFCTTHNKPIIKINLTENQSSNQKLFCQKCNMNNQQNLIYIGDVFKFLNETQAKYASNNQFLEGMILELNTYKQQILKYIANVESQIEQLRNNLEQAKPIKDSDIQKYLSKQNKQGNDELNQLAQLLSKITQNDGEQMMLKNDLRKSWEKDQLEKVNKGIALLKNISFNLGSSVVQQKVQSMQPIQPKAEHPSAIQDDLRFKQLSQVEYPTGIFALSFNQVGDILVVGGQQIKQQPNCYLQVWKLNNANQIEPFQCLQGHNRDVKSISYSQKEESFLSGSIDNSIIYWKLINKSQFINAQTINFHGLAVNCVKFNHQENYFASCCDIITIWNKDKNFNNEWVQGKFKEEHEKPILCLSFSDDDNLLVTGGQDFAICVYECKGNDWQLKEKLQNQVQQVIFISFLNSSNFMSVQQDDTITFWNFNEDSQNFEYKSQNENLQIKSAFYCQKSRLMAIVTKTNIVVSEVVNQSSICSKQEIKIQGLYCTFSFDGRKIAIASQGKLDIYSHEEY